MFIIACVLLLLTIVVQCQQRYYYYHYPTNNNYHRRTYYYPVRTNCHNPCVNRYRWNHQQHRPILTTSFNSPATTIHINPIVSTLQPNKTQSSTDHTQPTSTTTASLLTANWQQPKQPNNEAYTNPCARGKPLTNAYGTPISCNYLIEPNGGCPHEDYWCHTGVNFLTTACCPTFEKGIDRCKQPRAPGEGNALTARWYYDHSVGQCKRFLYRGVQGNSNNFLSQIGCEMMCKPDLLAEEVVDSVSNNPCRYGYPAKLDQERIICNATSAKCPSGYFCHIGESPETTACCESSGASSCMLALNVGQGNALIKRHYYNSIARRCTEFVYKGTKGNENNFLSLLECQKTCHKWSNPCPTLLDYGERQECRPDVPNHCGKGQWCHVGANQESTVCCPGAIIDPCTLSLHMGEGNATLPRWYVDASDASCTRECKPFIYRGAKGNQNNFLSKYDCEQTCKPQCLNPCTSSSELLKNDRGVPVFCSPASPCPNNHYCHIGAAPDSTVCCKSVAQPCQQPLETGVGDAKLTRWHFSQSLKRCVSFIYRGMGGNQNMHLTKADCENLCPSYENPCAHGQPLLVDGQPKPCTPNERCPSTHFCLLSAPDANLNTCCPRNGDPCDMDVSEGVGPFNLTRHYYDRESRRCREFIYHGRKGTINNFLSLDDCERTCPVSANPCPNGEPLLGDNHEPIICESAESCPNGYYCLVAGSPENTNCCPGTRRPCDLPLAEGTGTDSLERWYFDGGAQMCKKFVYRGMKGNSNNFVSRADCRLQCKEVNPCLHGDVLVDGSGDRILCTGGQLVDSCPAPTHYCHVGASSFTTVCCQRSGDPCEQPLNVGSGNEELPRWYFDIKTQSCLPFSYGGIGGGENNFIAKSSCEARCPENRHYCPHGSPLLDSSKKTPVICGVELVCPLQFICHMSAEYNVSVCCHDPVDFCTHPRDPGPCKGFETRFGYQPETDTCVEYSYGGCKGSLNNFQSMQRCTEICCKEYRRKML